MSKIDPSATLGELVAENPARTTLFERLHFDFCCGGAQTLAGACRQRGLETETVRTMLELIEEGPPLTRSPRETRDWRYAGIGELCDHIVDVHHAGLRRELPRIAELLATVVRVHGKTHPELHDLARLFGATRDELEHHLEVEERALFPACRAIESEPAAGVDDSLIALHEHEHAEVGDALTALRELTNDYDPAGAGCGTHRRLLEALREFELDLHQHVHEENNVLFPRVRRLAAATAGEGRHA